MGRAVQHHASTEPCGGALEASALECLNSGRERPKPSSDVSLGPTPTLVRTTENQAGKRAAPGPSARRLARRRRGSKKENAAGRG